MARDFRKLMHRKDRRQARRRFVPQVMKAEICQKSAIGASVGFVAFVFIASACTRDCTFKSPGDGVATNFENFRFFVALP